VITVRRKTPENFGLLYDADTGRTYENDRQDTITWALTVEPCQTVLQVTATPATELYRLNDGPVEKVPFTFSESPTTCNWGMTVATTQSPDASAFTTFDSDPATGHYDVSTTSGAHIGDYDINTKATLTLDANTIAWYTANGLIVDLDFDFVLTVEPCVVTSIPHTADFALTYILQSGPIDTAALSFSEVPNTCLFGFSTVDAWAPAEPTGLATFFPPSAAALAPTPTDGKYTLNSSDSAHIGVYTIDVTASLLLDAGTTAFFVANGHPTSEVITITLTVIPCIVTSIDHTADFSLTYELESGPVDTTALTFAENPTNCNYGFKTPAVETWTPAMPAGLATFVDPSAAPGKFTIDSSSLSDLGTYTIDVVAELDLDADELAYYVANGHITEDTITITLTVLMCEVTSFVTDLFVSDYSFEPGETPISTDLYQYTALPCSYPITYTITYEVGPTPPFQLTATEVAHDTVTQNFDINVPLTIPNFDLADTHTITITATLDIPIAASVTDYPYPRGALLTLA